MTDCHRLLQRLAFSESHHLAGIYCTMAYDNLALPRVDGNAFLFQSKTIRGTKNVSYDAQLCPVIAKGQRAPNARVTCQIFNKNYEELKSSCLDSQILKNPFQ
jgi:hypothetical protein